MKMNFFSGVSVFLALLLWGELAQAGVIVGGTRVIYDGGKRETTLSVRNPDKQAYLIQAWTDGNGPEGDEKDTPKPPFVVTPPLFRLDPGAENLMRIIRSGGNLPEDRESVFWMNVKSIPSMPETSKNVLQIAVKTRIKLFYRPSGIHAPEQDDYQQLTFRRTGNQLEVNNPTPYYVSFNSVRIGTGLLKEQFMMAAPKSTSHFVLPSAAAGTQVLWKAITDFGGETKEITSPLG